MIEGYIYIMTNPAFKEDLVKIGYSKDPEQRRKSLSRNSGCPLPFEIYATYAVYQRLSDLALHNLIDKINPELRLNQSKEYYIATPEMAYSWLEAVAQISHTESRLKCYKNRSYINAKNNNKEHKISSKRVSRPPFVFSMCNIKPGDYVAFIPDESIKVKVLDEKHVEYEGESYSLTGLTKKLLNNYRPVQGPLYFSYNGKDLYHLRLELE